MKKRLVSILLCLAMTLSLLPVTAAAVGQTPIADPYGTGLKVYSSNGTPTKWEEDENNIPVLKLGMGASVYIDGNSAGYVNARIETTTPASSRSDVTLVLDNVHLYYQGASIGDESYACIEVGESNTMNLWLIGSSTLGKDADNSRNSNGCNTIGVFGKVLGERFAGELFIADAPFGEFWYPNQSLGSDVGSLECIAGNGGAAGIGGVRNGGTHGDVTIESGKVTVEGSGKDGGSGGAGIGGSCNPNYSPNGGNVTINGGEVYVRSYLGGAAIGGAAGYAKDGKDTYGVGGHVAVNGGVLKARADVTADVTMAPYGSKKCTGMVIGAGANIPNVRTTMTNGKYDQSFSVQNAIVTLSANDSVKIYDYFPINAESYAEEADYLASHIKNCVFGYERYSYTDSSIREMQNVNVYGDFRLTQDYTLKEGDAISIPGDATFTVAKGVTLTVAPVTGTEGANYAPSEQGIILGRANSLIMEESSNTAPAGAVKGYGHRPEIFTLDIPEIDTPPADAKDMDVEDRVMYLAVVEKRNGTEKRIEAGNSVAELAPKVGSDDLLTVITAGHRGFAEIEGGYKISVDGAQGVYVSLTTNGSLTGSGTNEYAVFTITEEDGTVTAEGINIALVSASYTMFSPKSNKGFSVEFPSDEDMSSGKLALTAVFESTGNSALITIPELFGSSFMLESISPVKNSTALRFGGKLTLSTPLVNIAGIEITKLQLDFAGSSVTLGGIAGGGNVDIPKIAGFVGGKAETRINTFIGEGTDEAEFMFAVEAKTPVFDGEFYLDFKEAYGVMLPNSFYMAGKVGTQGIPLVPPTTVAYITGGGLGVYGLAETIGMKRLALPPIRLRMTGSGSIVDVMEGTVDLTVGPGYSKIELADIEIADALNVLEKVGMENQFNLEQFKHNERTYDVVALHTRMYIEAGLELAGIEFLEANGSVGFDAMTGLSVDMDDKKIYGLFRLQSAGELNGSLKVPKGSIFGMPFWDFNFADIGAGYSLSGTYAPWVSFNDPMAALDGETMMKATSFEGAIAAKVSFDVLLTKLWARVGYILGGSPTLDGGLGEGPELLGLDTSEKAPAFSNAEEVQGGERDGDYSFAQFNAKVLADTSRQPKRSGMSLMSVNEDIPTGVTLTEIEPNNDTKYTASIGDNISDPKQVMFVMTGKNNVKLAKEDFTITKAGNPTPLELITAERDEATGKQKNNNANFAIDEDGRAYFTIGDRENYTISSQNAIEIQAVLFTPYATLNETGTKLDEGNAEYVIDNCDPDAEYAVKVYLGESEGSMEHLLTEENNPTGSIALPTEGTMAPTGSYHVTVALMEKTTVTAESGDVTGWVIADTKNISDSFAYTYTGATYGTVAAPASATLAYSGNETMTAIWDEVTNAEGYIVTVYSYDNVSSKWLPTGITYQTAAVLDENGSISEAAPTSVVMALTDETRDVHGNYIPGLAPGNYKIGVKAFKNVNKTLDMPEGTDDVVMSSQVSGTEVMTTSVELKAATPPTLTYSNNVTPAFYTQENIQYVLLVNAQAQTFTVTSNAECTFTVKNVNTNTALTPTTITENNATSATVTVPAFTGSIQLEIVATKSSGDYTVNYVTVRLDDTAPTLTLNDGGAFFKSDAPANVTGRTEANAIVCAWATSGTPTAPTASTRATSDGTFALPLSDTGTFAVEAVDAAKNRSTPVKAIVENGSIVTPENVSYTQRSGASTTFTLTPHGEATLTELRLGSTVLTENTDYTADGSTYTLAAGTLDSLADGAHLLTFDMSEGNDPQALLTVAPYVAPPDYSSGSASSASAGVKLVSQGVSIPAQVRVADGTANVSFDAAKLAALLADGSVSGELSLDLTILSGNVSAAKLSKADWNAISKAVNDKNNRITGLTLKLDTGSLSFDGAAMAAAAELGGDITVSIGSPAKNELTEQQALMAGDRPVIDISVLSGNTELTDLKGGTLSVSIPYTPAPGENTDFLVVWYLNESGKLEAYPCKYADGKLSFVLSHMSVYTAAYFPFTDVPESQWYYGDAAWAYMAGLMLGGSNDQFEPHIDTSRAMVVTLLHRLKGEPTAASGHSFADVADGQWYSAAVAWAAEAKIVDGYDDGNFGPDDPVTREQMAAILYRYVQYNGGGFTGAWMFPLNFPDADKVGEWAYEAVCWCTMNGIINGNSDGTLEPQGNAERCQVAAILHRFCDSVKE